jgi:signal transduction histidine kinase
MTIVSIAFKQRSPRKHMSYRKHLYLIFKEAVNNAAKYSGCSELKVELAISGKGIRLAVTDNGRGFAEGERDARGGGQGLVGMRQRAQEIGAEFTVRSTPGVGTAVVLEPSNGGRSRTLGTQQRTANGSFAP